MSDENTQMMLPGEHGKVYITLQWKMVMTSGQPFTVRENNITVATGIITETLEPIHVAKSLGKIEIT